MRLTRALFLVFTLVLVFMVGRAQAACTVSQVCSNGSSVSCSGNSTCSASPNNHGSVTCDGATTLCPAYCPGSLVCSTRSQCFSYCAAVVPPGTAYFTVCANRCCACYY
jgi:hypothetical protein